MSLISHSLNLLPRAFGVVRRNFGSLPFKGSEKDLHAIQQHFQKVTTNVPSADLRTVLDVSKVILVGKSRGNALDQLNTTRIVNGFFTGRVLLLLEGGLHAEVKSLYPGIKDPDVLVNSQSWKVSDALDQEERQQQLAPFMKLRSNGFSILKALLVEHTSSTTPLELLEKLKEIDPAINANNKYFFCDFRRLAFLWVNQFIKTTREFDVYMDANFKTRQEALCNAVKDSLKQNYDKIVVVAGSAHLTPIETLNDDKAASVEMVQNTMQQLTTFTILDTRPSDTTTYLRLSELAASVLELNRHNPSNIPELSKTIRILESSLSNGRITPVDLIKSLNRMARLISPLRQ